MPHHIPLIATIAIALALAFAAGLLASRLRLPPLIGYLLVGVAIGPPTPGFVADVSLASQLAEIGVITHSEEELDFIRKRKPGPALMAEHELALGLARYALAAHDT